MLYTHSRFIRVLLGGSLIVACTASAGQPAPAPRVRRQVDARQPSRGAQEQVLYAFAGGSDGANPVGVIADASGALYGTTEGGGAVTRCSNLRKHYGCGTVFKLTPAGSGYTERVIHAFRGKDGAYPVSALLLEQTGALDGTASLGGIPACGDNYGCGTVFRLTPTASGYEESTLHTFRDSSDDGNDPLAPLILDGTGALFGTTYAGGSSEGGTVFQLAPKGAHYVENVLYDFGGRPAAGLLLRRSGALFGTTSVGGQNSQACSGPCGTVFELARAGSKWTESTVYEFQGYPSDGAFPGSALIADAHGALYGTTLGGGDGLGSRCFGISSQPTGCGTAFKLTRRGDHYVEAVLYDFQGGNDGENPSGLVADAKGDLYGTTPDGGKFGHGSVFKLTPEKSHYVKSVIYSFQGGADGDDPSGLIEVGGVFFGATSSGGGACDCGTVFRLTP
jgi:uncharacterized repeat protein (TIGR03803 family)